MLSVFEIFNFRGWSYCSAKNRPVIMIQYEKRSVKIAESWSDEDERPTAADVILHFCRPQATSKGCQPIDTILVDLSQDHGAIDASFTGHCRRKINQAEKGDGLTYNHWRREEASMDKALADFLLFYADFASQRALAPVDRIVLRAYRAAGRLALSRVDDAAGAPIIWHVHYLSKTRARCQYSASYHRLAEDSQRRNLIGRANRYMHWRDMLCAKTEGATVYDMGGWYSGSEDKEKLRIDRFKEDFGSTITHEYMCAEPLTLKGSIYLALRKASLAMGQYRRRLIKRRSPELVFVSR